MLVLDLRRGRCRPDRRPYVPRRRRCRGREAGRGHRARSVAAPIRRRPRRHRSRADPRRRADSHYRGDAADLRVSGRGHRAVGAAQAVAHATAEPRDHTRRVSRLQHSEHRRSAETRRHHQAGAGRIRDCRRAARAGLSRHQSPYRTVGGKPARCACRTNPTGAAAVARRRRMRIADCVRQHCQPPARARDQTIAGDDDPDGTWRRPRAARASDVHREPGPCADRRWNRPGRQRVAARRVVARGAARDSAAGTGTH